MDVQMMMSPFSIDFVLIVVSGIDEDLSDIHVNVLDLFLMTNNGAKFEVGHNLGADVCILFL